MFSHHGKFCEETLEPAAIKKKKKEGTVQATKSLFNKPDLIFVWCLSVIFFVIFVCYICLLYLSVIFVWYGFVWTLFMERVLFGGILERSMINAAQNWHSPTWTQASNFCESFGLFVFLWKCESFGLFVLVWKFCESVKFLGCLFLCESFVKVWKF